MPSDEKTASEKMHNLMEALADSVDGMTDEEVIQECIEDGEDPGEVAEKCRLLLKAAFEKVIAERKEGRKELR